MQTPYKWFDVSKQYQTLHKTVLHKQDQKANPISKAHHQLKSTIDLPNISDPGIKQSRPATNVFARISTQPIEKPHNAKFASWDFETSFRRAYAGAFYTPASLSSHKQTTLPKLTRTKPSVPS